MSASPGRANQATIYLSRSLASILNIHTDAASIGKLDPSWPQLKRITVCGQILVLCCSRGEIHRLEGADLFQKLIALLQAHVDFWPTAAEAIRAYRAAAAKLGTSDYSRREHRMQADEQGSSYPNHLDLICSVPRPTCSSLTGWTRTPDYSSIWTWTYSLRDSKRGQFRFKRFSRKNHGSERFRRSSTYVPVF